MYIYDNQIKSKVHLTKMSFFSQSLLSFCCSSFHSLTPWILNDKNKNGCYSILKSRSIIPCQDKFQLRYYIFVSNKTINLKIKGYTPYIPISQALKKPVIPIMPPNKTTEIKQKYQLCYYLHGSHC